MKIKAILFDMDGVLLDSERAWQKVMPNFRHRIGIENIPEEIEKQSYGISMATEHKLFQEQLGLKLTLQEFIDAYDFYATDIYPKVTLARELEKTLSYLKSHDIKLGIVTASVNIWVDLFKSRLSENYFDFILSLADSENLKQKPSPDGYQFAMKHFSVKPENTLVIEDSNRGIQAGKASGAITLASSEFIDPTYIQKEYDFKITTLLEIRNHL
jgi:HAD superfamily hydrolase (TIGR01509 family)